MTNNSAKPVPLISLFSGCGGMDLGFRQEGFLPIAAFDTDPAAVATYNHNAFEKVATIGDLSALSGKEIGSRIEKLSSIQRPLGVIGGPPCQSFSRSNVHLRSDDPRHNLPLHYAEIIGQLNKIFQLDFFVFENVVGLKSSKHEAHYARILDALEEAGFNIFEALLDASWFQVPQHRRRIFVVGINRELYPALEFTAPEPHPDAGIVTVEDAIAGLPEPTFFSRQLDSSTIPHHPNHWTMNPRSAKFTDGSIGKSEYRAARSFRKLAWNQPSGAVAYGNREIHVHPDGKRRLSIYEAMKLQGFPDDFQLLGNLSEQVKQVSDAVPPPMARAVAAALRRAIYYKQRAITGSLLDWFRSHRRHFPWRDTSDPYEILVAEKLLQQTSANGYVVEAYQSILEGYPSIEALASASPSDLEPIIEPLGFRYRAQELPALAKAIHQRHAGTVPEQLDQLLGLPGVGDYIARAVLCFGYGKAVPVVDTNVARFLHRVFGLRGRLPSNPARSRKYIALASRLVPANDAKSYNLAVLDLCSAICTPQNSRCEVCPVNSYCHTGQKRLASEDDN